MLAKNLFAAAFGIAAMTSLATPAMAGDCPSGSEVSNPLANHPTMPKDVTDTVIGSIDLGKDIGVNGRLLRTRMLVVQPGPRLVQRLFSAPVLAAPVVVALAAQAKQRGYVRSGHACDVGGT